MTLVLPKPLVLRDLISSGGMVPIDVPAAAGADAATIMRGLDTADLVALAGKTVLIASRSQAASAAALVALDGVAARIVICPPDFPAPVLDEIARQADGDAIISDRPDLQIGFDFPVLVRGTGPLVAGTPGPPDRATDWIMPTSGTTGRPKLVAHTLAALIGAVPKGAADVPTPVWATFYDIRRYGGLQIFLRACVAGTRLVLTDPSEPLGDFMARCAAAGVTHLTGTPSHWRRLLMSPFVRHIRPAYVRLSGEIADRAVLDALRATWPQASIVHAYASTEAGVAFEVSDGQEGFPASYLDGLTGVDLKIEATTLRIRSNRTAATYVGPQAPALRDADGFVDTDDVVERIGDRCFFRGRRSGVINVGGNKVHPEEVERVINQHPAVGVSRVHARRNPILGDLIAADVVLKPVADGRSDWDQALVKDEILSACKRDLARYKIPATLNFSQSLPLIGSGKMGRRHA